MGTKLEETIQLYHETLYTQRQKILRLAASFRSVSAAYYVLCDMNDDSVPVDDFDSDTTAALDELKRRDLIAVKPSALSQLAEEYVQLWEFLKLEAIKGVEMCCTLANMTAEAYSKAESPTQEAVSSVMQREESLDEALTKELSEEVNE